MLRKKMINVKQKILYIVRKCLYINTLRFQSISYEEMDWQRMKKMHIANDMLGIFFRC